MILSRTITCLLLLVSITSFGLAVALCGDQDRDSSTGAPKSQFLQTLLQPLMQDGVAAAEEEAAAAAPQAAAAVAGEPARKLAIFKSEEERDGQIRRTLVVGKGETLTSRLIMAGVTRTEALRAIDAMRPHVQPTKIRSGQSVVLLYTKTQDGEQFSGFELRAQPSRLVTIARAGTNTFNAVLKDVQPERRRFAMRGTVDDSLYQSGLKAGIPASVLATLIKTYSYSIDFQRDVKDGDRFEVLFEQTVDEAGQPQDEPTLIYAALQIAGRIMPIYRVAMPGGTFEYYDAKGESIRKGLLRTPVEGARITSTFGMRVHPIMGFSRMHKGIDFGVPTGSPIYAAGNGVVEEAGWKSGYGKYVRIRHSNHVSTAYAHMSQFGRGLTRGSRVSQGQIIGFVGATGMATGPHLHYEVLVDNSQVNPLNVAINTNQPLGGRQLAAFQDWRGRVHGQFEQLIASNDNGMRTAQNNVSSTVK